MIVKFGPVNGVSFDRQGVADCRGRVGSYAANSCERRNEIIVIRLPVNSSELASIGFDDASQILEVEFRSGAVYQYSGVQKVIYSELMSAQSHGSYFNEYVKKAGYPYVRVR